METIKITFTKGDSFTKPGGVILRQQDNGHLVAHTFSRAEGSFEPTSFFWGHYGADAEPAYFDKVQRARSNGSLIHPAEVSGETV
jgi:hypothetical protein